MGKIIKLSEWLKRRDAKIDRMVKEYPWLKLYSEVKRRHPKTILFYRMGDFYELFQGDALVASDILDIPITTKSLPMCGVPFHDASRHLGKMLKAGYRVATCETVDDSSSGSGFRHIVTRIVTKETGQKKIATLPNATAGKPGFLPYIPKMRDDERGMVNLVVTRRQERLTQRELAKRSGIPRRHISEMETGKRTIGKKNARTLAKVLNADYRAFL